MALTHLFLQEVTTELLYNIVYDHDEIDYSDLIEVFRGKTGYHPMDFFGFGNENGRRLLDFIEEIPGVLARKTRSRFRDNICFHCSDGDNDYNVSEDKYVYKVFNETDLDNLSLFQSVTVAQYRERILLKCCKMIANDEDLKNCKDPDLSNCKDAKGYTPLHYIAALPGLTYDCNTLVKYLLRNIFANYVCKLHIPVNKSGCELGIGLS